MFVTRQRVAVAQCLPASPVPSAYQKNSVGSSSRVSARGGTGCSATSVARATRGRGRGWHGLLATRAAQPQEASCLFPIPLVALRHRLRATGATPRNVRNALTGSSVTPGGFLVAPGGFGEVPGGLCDAPGGFGNAPGSS
jgi:hypothetical protein